MTSLFERQRLLKAAVSRQARLAKLEAGQVRSTEVEQLRMVNQAMLDVSSHVVGSVNPFRERNLNDAQLLAEDMLRRQGDKSRLYRENPERRCARPSKNSNRIRGKAKVDNRKVSAPHLADCFSLRGLLVRDFARAKQRGYKGPPSRWLRGSKARKLVAALPGVGFTFPPPDLWSIFDHRSPLHWSVSADSGVQRHNLSHGFRGERLRSEPTNFVVLRRQATSVPRLRFNDWP